MCSVGGCGGAVVALDGAYTCVRVGARRVAVLMCWTHHCRAQGPGSTRMWRIGCLAQVPRLVHTYGFAYVGAAPNSAGQPPSPPKGSFCGRCLLLLHMRTSAAVVARPGEGYLVLVAVCRKPFLFALLSNTASPLMLRSILLFVLLEARQPRITLELAFALLSPRFKYSRLG